MIAGPSEVLILADAQGNPGLDRRRSPGPGRARSLPSRSSSPTARARRCGREGRRAPAPDPAEGRDRRRERDYGAIILIDRLENAIPLADRPAPEHLEIETENAEELAAKVRNAGSIFLGSHTPEAIGDYVGGPNHVLPTARSARFSPASACLTSRKRTSILKCDAGALCALGPAAIALGRSEGLEGHARSVAIRLNL